MELEFSFDALGVIIATAQNAMATMAAIGQRLAAVLWSITVLLTLSVMIAGGATGGLAYIIRAIIWGGIVVGGLALWPTVVSESYATIQEASVAISGRDLNALEVARRGWDIFMRTYDHGFTWQNIMPWNAVPAAMIVLAGLGIAVIFAALSLVIAVAIVQFFIGAVVAPLVIPFILAGPLAGFGMTLVGFILSSVVYLTALSVIISLGEAVFLDAAIPGPDEALTFGDLGAVAVASAVVLFLAWRGSSFAAQITRGASGGTGMTGIFGTLAGLALGSAGAAAAGSAAGGPAATGAAARGGSGGGSPGRGSGGGDGGSRGPSPRGTSYRGQVGRLSHVM